MSILKFQTCALMAVLAMAGVSVMQGAEQGTFHLTTPTYWGRVLLQPGDYKIYLPDVPIGETNVRVEGNGKTVFEMPLVATTEQVSDASYLKLTGTGGSDFVTEYRAGLEGKDFEFKIPKASWRQQEASNGAGLTFRIIAVRK